MIVGWVELAKPIGVNLVSNVCASDTPFAPLGLAIGRVNAYLYTYRLSEAWQIASQHQRCGRCIEYTCNKKPSTSGAEGV